MACHRAMIPQAFGYGRRDWVGFGLEKISSLLFTSMIPVHGCSFMEEEQAISFYSMTTGSSGG